jgi:hypothetical protein
MSAPLPDLSLKRVYRLEAALGDPLDLGDVAQGHRRIVPLTGGTFTGPELNGTLVPGVSADCRWCCRIAQRSATSAIALAFARVGALDCQSAARPLGTRSGRLAWGGSCARARCDEQASPGSTASSQRRSKLAAI